MRHGKITALLARFSARQVVRLWLCGRLGLHLSKHKREYSKYTNNYSRIPSILFHRGFSMLVLRGSESFV